MCLTCLVLFTIALRVCRFVSTGDDLLALSVGRAAAGHWCDHPSLGGDRHLLPSWHGCPGCPSASAKLYREAVLITAVRGMPDRKHTLVSFFCSAYAAVSSGLAREYPAISQGLALKGER